MTMEKAKKKTTKAAKCACPFCEEMIEVTALPFCQTCGVAIVYCVTCQTPAPRNAKVCPKCGGKLTSK
jgi:membrane protease subunit (stomatin/prohibitin family)